MTVSKAYHGNWKEEVIAGKLYEEFGTGSFNHHLTVDVGITEADLVQLSNIGYLRVVSHSVGIRNYAINPAMIPLIRLKSTGGSE
jgi:hypothetical protein